MLKQIKTLCWIIPGLLLLFSCKHDPENIVLPDPEPEPSEKPCHPDTVYFKNDILPIFQSSCAMSGCHDAVTAQDGVILDSYANIISTGDVKPGNPEGSDIFEVIAEDDPDKRMPPPPATALPAAQIEMIRTWILQGALDNYCDETGPCDTLNVSFSQTLVPIIQTYCLGCHSGASPQGGILLSNHAEVSALGQNGQLLGAIDHQPGYSPMPQNGNKLSECQIAQFRNWINDGTPNN
jgi:hypothetical protein